jgi:hypothetical protein
MAPIDETIEYLDSLGSGEHFLYQDVAEKSGVDRRTLARRHKGLTQSMTTKQLQ